MTERKLFKKKKKMNQNVFIAKTRILISLVSQFNSWIEIEMNLDLKNSRVSLIPKLIYIELTIAGKTLARLIRTLKKIQLMSELKL